MNTASPSPHPQAGAASPPPAPATVLIAVRIPARVKEWLEREAQAEGLAFSAHVRRRLTRAYTETTHAASDRRA